MYFHTQKSLRFSGSTPSAAGFSTSRIITSVRISQDGCPPCWAHLHHRLASGPGCGPASRPATTSHPAVAPHVHVALIQRSPSSTFKCSTDEDSVPGNYGEFGNISNEFDAFSDSFYTIMFIYYISFFQNAWLHRYWRFDSLRWLAERGWSEQKCITAPFSNRRLWRTIKTAVNIGLSVPVVRFMLWPNEWIRDHVH